MHEQLPPALFPVPRSPGRKCWCGPTAIAALTGLHYQCIETAITGWRRGHPPRPHQALGPSPLSEVHGMWPHEIVPVLNALGWRAVEYHDPGISRPLPYCPPLAGWIADRGSGLWLIAWHAHFVAIHKQNGDATFVDTFNPAPVPLHPALCDGQRVLYAWRIGRYPVA